MNFSTDRDLLVLEPGIFAEVALASQARVSVSDAAVSGVTLTSASADFESAQVDAGGVVLIGDVAHEVVARLGPQSLTVSLPRARLSDAAIPGVQGAALGVVCRTFAPQAALVHDALLRLLGVEPGEGTGGGPAEGSIVSLSVLAHLEALATAERVYAGAGTLIEPGGWRDTLLLKADGYRRRFGEAAARAVVLIDADGDGVADRRVRLGSVNLVRV